MGDPGKFLQYPVGEVKHLLLEHIAVVAEPLARAKRAKVVVNYRELADVRLPKAARKRTKVKNEELFPITIVERQESRVKVHYIGYSSNYDEWKDVDELECLSEPQDEIEDSDELHCDPIPDKPVCCEPFSLYRNLAVKIKQSLSCRRKSSPTLRIVIPFDLILFNGGLKEAGIRSKKVHGNQYYQIHHYRDLNHLLGKNWQFQGININGDNGYAVMESVEYHLSKSRSLKEYFPSEDGTVCMSLAMH